MLHEGKLHGKLTAL